MISGYTMVFRAVEHDFCIEACVKSLAACCDEVVVGYSPSEDGTLALLERLSGEIPSLRIEHTPVDETVIGGGAEWVLDWMDRVRGTLKHEYQVFLDADEVLAEWSIPEIKKRSESGDVLDCKRHNFWGRLDRITPHGVFCGSFVPRCAPTRFSLPSDFPVTVERCPILTLVQPSNVEIFHYGTLRSPSTYLSKAKLMHVALAGSFDERIESTMKLEGHWTDHWTFKEPFIPYTGKHPEVAHEWLKSKGYNP